MASGINSFYRFEGFEADAINRVLKAAGKPVSIPARAFDLLIYMVCNRERLLTKEELMGAVWGDVYVEDGNLTQAIFVLRKALSAARPENKFIVTVPGRGYRFEVALEEIAAPAAIVPELSVAPAPARRRSIPVLAIAGGLGIALVVALIAVAALLHRPVVRTVAMPRPITTNSADNPVVACAISPDGKYLAYADAQFLTIRTMATGETRSLPVDAGAKPLRVEWFSDGARFLIAERIGSSSQVLVYSILTGALRLVRGNALGPAVSPGDRDIFFADTDYRELWLMDPSGENARKLMTVTAPDHVYSLFWSPDGMRLWFARVHWDKDVYTITLETCDRSGNSPTVVLSNNRASAFRLLPGGKLVYAIEEDGPQKYSNLWEMPVDAVAGKPQGPARKLTNWTSFNISYLSAPANGKSLFFTNGGWQANVYLGELRNESNELANTRRLTMDQSDNWPSFWTDDSQAVVFESTRNGRSQIFRQGLERTVPELLSMDSDEDEFPKFGGAWVYFFSLPRGGRLSAKEPVSIRKLPAAGGASSEVMKDVGVDVNCAMAHPDICVVAHLRDKQLTFYRFDAVKGQGAEISAMPFSSSDRPDFGVSPDGTEVATVTSGGEQNRIRRISVKDGRSSEVEVAGRKGLENLFWASDGKGWFVASQATAGQYLLHVNSKGESSVLFEQPDPGLITWGVPSRDGRKLAFLRWTSPKNVWSINDF